MARRSPAKVIGSRLLQALPVILLATFMVFALLKLVPGDIAVTLAGDNATDARIAEIRKVYGLDRPFLVQYGAWLGKVVQGDLSQSLLTGEKVATSIGRAFPNTLLIVVIALVLALLTGIPMGVIAAIKPNGWVDKISQHDRLARRRDPRLLAGDDPGRGNFAEAELAAGDRRKIVRGVAAGSDPSCAAAGHCDRSLWHGRGGAAVARLAAGSAVVAICADAARQGPVDDAHPLAARAEECQPSISSPSSACWSTACWRRPS